MWDAFSIIGKIVTALIGFYVTGNKTKKDLDDAFYAWARVRGRGNESADDRESVDRQHQRITEDRMKVLMDDIDKEMKETVLADAKKKVEGAEPKQTISDGTLILPIGKLPTSPDGKRDKEV